MAAGLRAPKDPSMEVREMAREARGRSRHTHTSQQFHPRVVSIAGKVDSGASDTELESWRIGPALSGASPSPTDTALMGVDGKEVDATEGFVRPAFFASSAANVERTDDMMY
nr:hypothetical protein Iba_chr11aCG2710 [Ipomoea batatas]